MDRFYFKVPGPVEFANPPLDASGIYGCLFLNTRGSFLAEKALFQRTKGGCVDVAGDIARTRYIWQDYSQTVCVQGLHLSIQKTHQVVAWILQIPAQKEKRGIGLLMECFTRQVIPKVDDRTIKTDRLYNVNLILRFG